MSAPCRPKGERVVGTNAALMSGRPAGSGRWMRAPIDRHRRAWLDSGGSLSRRIEAAFGGFAVQRVRQRAGAATAEEWRALGVRGGRRVHVREVVLWGDGQPLVLARSVLPAVQAGLAWRAVRGLGSRPLADLLFGSRALDRRDLGRLRCPCFQAPARWPRFRAALGATDWPAGATWGRRARFTHRGVPLLLTEWFSAGLSGRLPGRVKPTRESASTA